MKEKQLPPPRPHARYCRDTSKSRQKSFKEAALAQLQQAELPMLRGLPLRVPITDLLIRLAAGIKARVGALRP